MDVPAALETSGPRFGTCYTYDYNTKRSEYTRSKKYFQVCTEITEIPQNIPKEAEHVAIQGNPVTKLQANAFHGLFSCKLITLNYNLISMIHADAFAGLTSLAQLWLTGNRISHLEPTLFQGLKQLREIYIQENELSAIDAPVFSGLPELFLIHINGNKLTTLSKDIFGTTSHPTNLDLGLSRNPLWCDAQICWLKEGWLDFLTGNPECSNGVEWEALNCGSIPQINPQEKVVKYGECYSYNYNGGFARVEYLLNQYFRICAGLMSIPQDIPREAVHVAIQGNPIKEIPANVFLQLSRCQRMVLNYNLIKIISQGAFSGLTNLQQLSLTGNRIEHISRTTLHGLTSLKEFYIENNFLTEIEDGTFSDLPLNLLQLDGNKLTTLNENIFSSGSHPLFLTLGLSDNLLCRSPAIHSPSFNFCWLKKGEAEGWIVWIRNSEGPSTPKCWDSIACDFPVNATKVSTIDEFIDVGNALHSLSTENIPSNCENIAKIDLQRNEFTIIYKNQFSTCKQLRGLWLNHNKIKMVYRESFSGLGRLQELYLQNNDLESFPREVIRDLPALKRLDLSHNKLSTVQYLFGTTEKPNMFSLGLYNNPISCDLSVCWLFDGENEGNYLILYLQVFT